MEKTVENVTHGSRYSNVKKSFRRCLGFLLTAFPFEDFSKAFPSFNGAEQEQLYQLYVQLLAFLLFSEPQRPLLKYLSFEEHRKNCNFYKHVITSLYENLQDDFNLVCHETKVGTTLDTVEHLVEQQSLDPLFSKKNLDHLKHDLLATKENEVHLLEGLLDKVEDQKHSLKARIKLLKKKGEDTSGHTVTLTEAAEKLRCTLVKYGSSDDERPRDPQ